jgi:hypothetical protein
MKNLFLENSLHYYKKGKSKMIKPLGIFRFQGVLSAYYTIPKINRELQPAIKNASNTQDYTIPKINRELQPNRTACFALLYYTIPKINRELQLFIRCQGGKEGLNFDLKKNVFFWEQIFKKVLTNSF